MLEEIAKGRPIFVDGIPDLKIDHQVIEARQWPTSVPDGALVVIDEVQRVWRPAGPGQKVPEDIALLETHRHRGLDFIVITQHPKLVHTNVRNLVGRHVHLRDLGILGRWWYEWPEAADPGNWRSAPIKKRYRLPSRVFGKYKSATEHIKPARSIPPSLIVLVVASLIAAVLFGRMIWRFVGNGEDAQPVATTSEPVASGGVRVAGRPAAGASPQITGTTLTVAFMPRLSADPGSAPAYDHLRVVKAMPRIVGGWCLGDQPCRCLTQQGTDAEVPEDVCREWVARPKFDPYRAEREPGPPPRAPGDGESTGLTTAPKVYGASPA